MVSTLLYIGCGKNVSPKAFRHFLGIVPNSEAKFYMFKNHVTVATNILLSVTTTKLFDFFSACSATYEVVNR